MKKIIFTATLVMVCMISGMAYADWEQLAGLPRAVGQPGAAVVNGHLVVFGGSEGSSVISSTYTARINDDGSLGNWVQQWADYIRSSNFNATPVSGNYIYGIAGWHPGWYHNDIAFAEVSSTGSINRWTRLTSFPRSQTNHGVVVYGGYIYVIGGINTNLGALDNVTFAEIGVDGTLGVWRETTPLPQPVRYPGAVVNSEGKIFVLGGQYLDSWDSNTEFNSIYMAEIGSDNTVGPWTTAGTLPIAGILLSDSAFLINDQTVIVAISSNGADVQVFKGRISNDQIGEWEALPAPPAYSTKPTFVYSDGSLYVLGGSENRVYRLNLGSHLDLGQSVDNKPPPAPKLTVTTHGTTVTISWTSVENADGYTLFYAPYPEANYIGDIDMGNQTSLPSFDGKGYAFYVVVQAYNSAGNSDYSNIEHFHLDETVVGYYDIVNYGVNLSSIKWEDFTIVVESAAKVTSNETRWGEYDFLDTRALIPWEIGDGNQTDGNQTNDKYLPEIGHGNQTKVLISIGDVTGYEFASVVEEDGTGINGLVEQIVNIVKNRGYDGVDIDWENIPCDEECCYVKVYRDFISKLREELGRSSIITVALQGWATRLGRYSLSDIEGDVNFFMLMGYDDGNGTGENPNGPWDKPDDDHDMKGYLDDIEKVIGQEKMIYLLPFYYYNGSCWEEADGWKDLNEEERIKVGRLEMDEDYLEKFYKNDDSEGYINDPLCIRAKVEAAISEFPDIGGFGCWQIGHDSKFQLSDVLWKGAQQIANVSPTASITSPSDGSTFGVDETISFQGSGSDTDGYIVSYKWRFGDGSLGLGENWSHAYSSTGTYTVMLTVEDNEGETATDSISVTVYPLNFSPTELTATAVSSSQIDLSWNISANNTGVAGYKIYRDGSYLDSVTSTSYSDTGLSPDIQYCYTVSAYNEANNESGQSNQACARTYALPSPSNLAWKYYVNPSNINFVSSITGEVIIKEKFGSVYTIDYDITVKMALSDVSIEGGPTAVVDKIDDKTYRIKNSDYCGPGFTIEGHDEIPLFGVYNGFGGATVAIVLFL